MSEEKKSVWELLRGRYPKEAYALLAEVSNSAGHSRSRSLDYMAVSFWPSRGLAIHGIEQKSSRADWMNEIKNPAKSHDFIKHCDRFWLLTTNEKVANLHEIPETWGWMSVKGSRLITMKEAPKLQPEPITKSFAICLIRRAVELLIHPSEIKDRIDAAIEEHKKWNKSRVDQAEKEYLHLKEKVDEFEKASGVFIDHSWDIGDIGTAVSIVKKHIVNSSLKHSLEHQKKAAEEHIRMIEEALKKLEPS